MPTTQMQQQLQMPSPPQGCMWVLEFDPARNQAWLWTYQKHWLSWLTGNPSLSSRELEFVERPNDTWSRTTKLSDMTTEEIVEGTVMAAHKILNKLARRPALEAAADARVNEISNRLNIKVRVRKQ